MSIDPYAPCPCGSGKKLKFCCSDLAGEIEKIEKLISGEQPHAALRHIERLLEKQPERASLLDLRASIELGLEEYDKARDTIQQYLQLHPENASAYAQAAFLAAGKGETAAAVGALQAALERIEDNLLPVRLYQALGAVGHALLVQGNLVAAQAHLMFYTNAAPEGDSDGLDLLMRLNSEGRPPLLLRDSLRLAGPPEGVAWEAACREANRHCGRGLWQQSEAEYVNLLDEFSAESAPAVVYNLALVRGWLGDTPRLAAGLRQYARLDVPLENAVEALALANTVDPSDQDSIVETKRQEFAISQDDDAFEQLLSDRRAVQVEVDEQAAERAGGPARGTFMILDRPALNADQQDQIAAADVPVVLGLAAVYGKRTDREAQLTLTSEEGAEQEAALDTLKQILGDALGNEIESSVVHKTPQSLSVLQWRWHLPSNIDPARRETLRHERRRQVILEQWIDTPLGVLDGRTPADLVGDQSQQVDLAAAVLALEQAAITEQDAITFQELREKLKLPLLETIEPDEVDISTLPLIRVARLNFRAVSSTEIEMLLARLLMCAAELATSRLATEMVRRVEEDDDAQIDATQAYRQLVASRSDPREALEAAHRAKAWAEKHGHNTAEWGLRELELQLELGSPEGVRDSIAFLKERHGKDPQVGEMIYRLLYAAGLGPLLEEGRQAPPPGPAEETPATPAIWTPDAPPAGSSSKGSSSAIWTP